MTDALIPITDEWLSMARARAGLMVNGHVASGVARDVVRLVDEVDRLRDGEIERLTVALEQLETLLIHAINANEREDHGVSVETVKFWRRQIQEALGTSEVEE